MNIFDDFKEYELYPALYEHIDGAFPSMDFRRKGNRWESCHHLNGDRDKRGKAATYIYANSKFCAIDHSRDEKKGLIDLYMALNNTDFMTAATSLADLCGLTVPHGDRAEWEQRKRKQDDRQTARQAFISALWTDTPEAEKVRGYLHGRGWTDDEILSAGLGLITTDIRRNLADRDEYRAAVRDKDGKTVAEVGVTHTLVIPFQSGSRILGFKFRETDTDTGTKYLNSYGMAKGASFFNIGVGIKDAVIVEGELDALHAHVKGAASVVATAGGAATEDQIRDAMKRGVERFTLLYDNDMAGAGFTERTIERAEEAGADVYIARLPEGCKDTDEYLRDHSTDDFNAIVTAAEPSYLWQYYAAREKYMAAAENQPGGNLTLKQREDFLNEVAGILNSKRMIAKPYNREVIYAAMDGDKDGLLVGMDGYREYVDREYNRQQAKERRAEVEKAAEGIRAALEKGDTDNAVKIMRDTAATAGTQDRAAEFSKVFTPPTAEALTKFLAEGPEGIPTGYTFRKGVLEEKLTLNPGLTFICANRGHGKTTFLNNLALNEAERNVRLGNGRRVLYFSYEVDKRRLIADLLNTYVNDKNMSRNPSNTILADFKGNAGYFASGQTEDGSSHYEHYRRKRDEFFRDYLGTGAITIVDENYKVGKLLDGIKFYAANNSVSLVCLDYVQLLYSEDYSRQRTEELKKVVNDIKDFANGEGLPFVLAAQFNRNVNSPVSVNTANIGEAGDIERIADTVIGLYNLKELHPLPGDVNEEKECKKLLSGLFISAAYAYRKFDALEGIDGKIFVRLLKRRYGYYPIDTILDWEGRTKLIKPNDPEALDTDPERQAAFWTKYLADNCQDDEEDL